MSWEGRGIGYKKVKWINTVEFLAGTYYLFLAILGFHNIYMIFYKQKKYSSIIFPLLYLFG